MKKGLLVILIVLFATAAYAEVQFSISGDMFARGNYFRNQSYYTGASSNVYNNGHATQKFMDGAVHLYPKIKIDNATINLKITMRDEIWRNSNTTANVAANTTVANTDNNIAIERAWLTYLFTENTILDVGLMDGSVWGSTFADFLAARYRVKLTQKTPAGVFGLVYEKNAEESNPNMNDAYNNNDDATNYALFAITKAGNVWIKPLFFMVNNSSGNPLNDVPTIAPFKSMYGAIQFNGDLGPISFDSEFGYKSWEFTKKTVQAALTTAALGVPAYYHDGATWGAYLNIFKAADFGKAGIIGTYGSWDKDAGIKHPVTGRTLGWGFSNGNDFKSNLIFGGKGVDSINLVSVPLGVNATDFDYAGQDLTGFHMGKLYLADIKTGVKNLTISGSGSWMRSNQKDNRWDGAKAYEFDLGAAYKLSNNVTYSVDAGWGRLAFSKWARGNVAGVENPSSIYAVQHMIKLVF